MSFTAPQGQVMWKVKKEFEYPEGSGQIQAVGRKICHINFKDEQRLIDGGYIGPRKALIRGAHDRTKKLRDDELAAAAAASRNK